LIKEEWGKTRYDDILKRYRIGKSHLYSIITTDMAADMAKKLKVSMNAIQAIRKRHDLIVRESRKRKTHG
jgi:hypothetical protein